MGMVSQAVQMVQPNDIVFICLDDTFNPYYLIKSLTKWSEITDKFCDDYGHTFPLGHTVVKGHYLEVCRISPELNTIDGKKKGKIIQLFEITNYVDEILLGVVTQYTFKMSNATLWTL